MPRTDLSFAVLTIALLAAPALSGVAREAAAAAPREDAHTVRFVAHDHGFTGPDRIPAGVTALYIANQGHDLHHLQVLRLPAGKTETDLRAALAETPGRFPQWVQFVGGPNAVVPGGEAVATMRLDEGQYVLTCLIPDKAGVPHMALGMQKGLVVRGTGPTRVSAPRADVTITLADYRFVPSTALTAGLRTIRVTNQGTQPHEVVLVKLDAGASARDFGAAFEPGGSGIPPGRPIGGVVGIDRGTDAYFTARLEPGRYGLICFFPDPITGKPHFLHGMTADLTVQ